MTDRPPFGEEAWQEEFKDLKDGCARCSNARFSLLFVPATRREWFIGITVAVNWFLVGLWVGWRYL